MRQVKNLEPSDWKILEDLFYNEPDCAKFISRRLNLDLKITMDRLKYLEELDMVERVKPTFIKKNNKIKHRNHTYYNLKREVRKFLKKKIKGD